MVFNSIAFLFFFLPFSLGIYFLSLRGLRNVTLLALSLIFYTWGESVFVLVLLLSITANYFFGLLIERYRTTSKINTILFSALIFNLGLLGFFKYANFFVNNINPVLTGLQISPIHLAPVHLPLGISFFTFQALSYVLDIYYGKAIPDRTYIGIGLYIAFFPRQLAGPLVSYKNAAAEITSRQVTLFGFTEGIQRFTLGLAKKTLIATSLAEVADQIFSLNPEVLGTDLAWLGIICYTLQIYFDFSAYSDMAVGLGAMFGFHLPENFNFPYIATSIRDFWKRWHISLTNWIRGYLFIPLSRYLLKSSKFRSPRAVEAVAYLVVMSLVGLWHGANWTFVIWGFIHAVCMAVESLKVGAWLSKWPRILQHTYVLILVMIGWVFFRSETLSGASSYLQAMFSFRPSTQAYNVGLYLDNEILLALIAGLVFSLPIIQWFVEQAAKFQSICPTKTVVVFQIVNSSISLMVTAALFLLAAFSLFSDTYSPFIYFRF